MQCWSNIGCRRHEVWRFQLLIDLLHDASDLLRIIRQNIPTSIAKLTTFYLHRVISCQFLGLTGARAGEWTVPMNLAGKQNAASRHWVTQGNCNSRRWRNIYPCGSTNREAFIKCNIQFCIDSELEPHAACKPYLNSDASHSAIKPQYKEKIKSKWLTYKWWVAPEFALIRDARLRVGN